MTLKRNYNRKLGTIICDNCGKEFQKPLSEIKRSALAGRNNYCCRECVGQGLSRIRKGILKGPANEKTRQHLKEMCNNRRDNMTPFRYTLRSIKRRFKTVDVDLNDLKEQWERQDGICPFTGLKLTLPEDGNIKNVDFFIRASLDRIDSAKGYIKGNIQFVSTPINFMKNDKSDDEVKSFLKKISSFTSKFK